LPYFRLSTTDVLLHYVILGIGSAQGEYFSLVVAIGGDPPTRH